MTDTKDLTLYLEDALNLTPRVLDHVRRLGLGLYRLDLSQTAESTATLRLCVTGNVRQLRLLGRRLSQIPGIERQLPDTPSFYRVTNSAGDHSPIVECSPLTSISQPG